MLFPHHYKLVDVRVQIKEIFLFLGESSYFFLFFSIFIPIFLFFASHLALDTLVIVLWRIPYWNGALGIGKTVYTD